EDGSSDFVSDDQHETTATTTYTRTILSRDPEGKETTLTKQQTEQPKKDPHDKPEDPEPADGGDHMQDPDAVDYSTALLTDADISRAISRINAVRTPGPDTGLTDVFTNAPQDKRGWVSLFAADGVTIFAAGATPTLNPLQPDYDPHLKE